MRRGRVLRTSVLAVVAGAAWGLTSPHSPAVAKPPSSAGSTTADPTLGPLISGTSSYVAGTYVWTDYAYDDRGPDTDGIPGGAATYPEESAPGNTADLIQLQVSRRHGGDFGIRAVLNSLVDPDVPVLGVGFDTDDDPSTGALEVPGGQRRSLGSLGL